MRAFFICRRVGTKHPYQGYAQILVGETELFYACLAPENLNLFDKFLKRMEEYTQMFLHHEVKAEDGPVGKVMSHLLEHFEWMEGDVGGHVGEEDMWGKRDPLSAKERAMVACQKATMVLEKGFNAMQVGSFKKLHWSKTAWHGMAEWRGMMALASPKEVEPRAGKGKRKQAPGVETYRGV